MTSTLKVGPPPAVVVSVARVQTQAVVECPQVFVPPSLHEVVTKAIFGTDFLCQGRREYACSIVRETFVVFDAL